MDTQEQVEYGDHKHNEDCERWCDVAPAWQFRRQGCPECCYVNGTHEQNIPQQHYTHCARALLDKADKQ